MIIFYSVYLFKACCFKKGGVKNKGEQHWRFVFVFFFEKKEEKNDLVSRNAVFSFGRAENLRTLDIIYIRYFSLSFDYLYLDI